MREQQLGKRSADLDLVGEDQALDRSGLGGLDRRDFRLGAGQQHGNARDPIGVRREVCPLAEAHARTRAERHEDLSQVDLVARLDRGFQLREEALRQVDERRVVGAFEHDGVLGDQFAIVLVASDEEATGETVPAKNLEAVVGKVPSHSSYLRGRVGTSCVGPPVPMEHR